VSDVAVVVPNHNGNGLVGRCVEAALAAGAAEVVVVDDASSDDSTSEARAAGAHVLPSRGRGFSTAVNTGVAATHAPYVLLLNSDCFVEPHAIRRLATALDENPSLALCGAHLRNADGSPAKSWGQLVSASGALSSAIRRGRSAVASAGEHGVERVPYVPLACALCRRADWDVVGGLDEGYRFYFEDYDLCLRLERANRGVAVCWDAEALHVGGASSSARDPQRWFTQYHESRARYLRKAGGAGFVAYVLLWPPLALAHALRVLVRGGSDAHRWANAYRAAATAGLRSAISGPR
jgi:N-acetylglucosaminyl-diphospho-decaprenol L-rhamnosyltransferase